MGYSADHLRRVFRKTDGQCHLCHGRIVLREYGNAASKVGWERDHGVARARGGGDWIGNLWPAHCDCNRSKQARSSRSARRDYGQARAPMSREAKAHARGDNALGGAILGGLVAALFWGGKGVPWGITAGAALGHAAPVR